MGEEPTRSKKKTKSSKPAKGGNALVSWAIRGVVFGVLAVLMILALLDFQAKQAATSTAEAWRNALRSKGENSDFLKSEFVKIPLKGNPATTSAKAGPNSFGAATLETFEWKGTFRKYVVKVYLGLGNDPPVDQIEGPGDTGQQ